MNFLVKMMGYSAIRRVTLFILISLTLSFFDLSGMADIISNFLGITFSKTISAAIAIALISAAIVINIALISKLAFKTQVAIFWLELLMLFLAFFYSFDLSYAFIIERLPLLLGKGVFYTLFVSVIAIIFASIIATFGAIARLSKSGPAYALVTFYVSFFRGTPLLLQVYLIYLGLPQLGIVLDAIPSGILALSLSYGAYMTEIFRAGIQSIPRSQTEGATALGLQPWQTMYKVVLPQAFKVVIPPLGNNFISMLKDSSLVSAMGVMELMYLARALGRSEFRHFEMLITAALIYWAISFIFEMGQAKLEARFASKNHG